MLGIARREECPGLILLQIIPASFLVFSVERSMESHLKQPPPRALSDLTNIKRRYSIG